MNVAFVLLASSIMARYFWLILASVASFGIGPPFLARLRNALNFVELYLSFCSTSSTGSVSFWISGRSTGASSYLMAMPLAMATRAKVAKESLIIVCGSK